MSVQYGPRALATAVHLNQYQMLALKRTSDLMDDLFDLSMSEATIVGASVQAAELLAPPVKATSQAIPRRS